MPEQSSSHAPLLSPESVQTQLERIVAGHTFASTDSLRRLLRFLVERTLLGQGDQLKEYVLGVEVFDRGDRFDARLDSIVRTQASKLRSKLREYYETVGQQDPILIDLPKGAYVPVFRARAAEPAAAQLPSTLMSSEQARWSWRTWGLGLGLVGLLIGVTFYGWRSHVPRLKTESTLIRLTYDSGLTTDPAVSPDGKLLAYASDRSGEGNLDIWVQQIQGGAPLRLTRDSTDEREPSFSPDGSQIVFRSERDGGGIYAIPTLGGLTRKIAPVGRRPHFSPNGRQIVYWVGRDVYGKMYTVSASGGASVAIWPEFNHLTYPIWAPDGKHILLWGNRSQEQWDVDWWVVPLVGGVPVRTGAWSALTGHHLQVDVRSLGDWMWVGNHLVFSARQGDSINLWTIPISDRTWQISGSPQRLTFGTDQDVLPSFAPPGTLAFVNLSKHSQIWRVPIHANKAQITGSLQEVTHEPTSEVWPSISVDGKKLVYASKRSGNWEIWLKDLASGDRERSLTPAPGTGLKPVITGDGSKVAFGPPFPAVTGEGVGLYTVAAAGGIPERVCEHCGYPTSWSRDQQKILYALSPYGNPRWLDLASGQRHLFLRLPSYSFWGAQFSPDDRWIAFEAFLGSEYSRNFIAPFPEGAESTEDAWIAVSEAAHWESAPSWSPDGNWIYFSSDRDGFSCLWAQRLDEITKRPRGTPVPICHLHNPRHSIQNMANEFGLSVAQDQVVFNMAELTGNIWVTRLDIR